MMSERSATTFRLCSTIRMVYFAEMRFIGAAVETVEHRFGTPEIEGVPVLTLQRDPDVLQRRQMREHRRNLERAHQTETRHVGRRQRRDILSLVQDLPGRRPQELGQEIETRRLAGPVRPDQRMNTATANPQIDTANGKKPREFLAQSVGFENELIGQSNLPHQPSRTTCRRAWPILVNRQVFQTPWKSRPGPTASGRNMPSTVRIRQGAKLGIRREH